MQGAVVIDVVGVYVAVVAVAAVVVVDVVCGAVIAGVDNQSPRSSRRTS